MDERDRAEALATAYEDRLVGELSDERRARGAFYTPPDLVAWILDRALRVSTGSTTNHQRVLDPACGTGHFLVAAARRLGVLAVHGSDLDPEAVRIARLRLEAEDPSVPAEEIESRVRVADGLTAWDGQRFDAVIGNPPFLGQLKTRTAGQRGGLGAYTDTSAAFLHRALDLVVPGGTVALVQPLSVLGARDAGPVRVRVSEVGALTDLWVSARPVFRGTSVLACVPVVRIGASGGPGTDGWGRLAAPYFGIPDVELPEGAGVLGDLAVCTADFRDQYYGLVPHVREGSTGQEPQPNGLNSRGLGPNRDPHHPPLITSGLIEPGSCEWGRRPTRFARRRYDAPVVDVDAVRAGPLERLGRCPARPQGSRRWTRSGDRGGGGRTGGVAPVGAGGVGRPAPDRRSVADPRGPAGAPVVAHAASRYLGTGLTPGSVKVSARQLAALPLPPDGSAWTEGAGLARRGAVARAAEP